jgi:hypothetical protein
MTLKKRSLSTSLKVVLLALALLWGAVAGVNLLRAQEAPGLKNMVKPKYSEGKELMLPEDYRTWVFVGASIGLSYSESTRTDAAATPGAFHHIYIQPEAYAHFKKTGQFPEKTLLVMEVHRADQKVSINKGGFFEGDRVALEVALKDHEKFDEGWAYFDFANGKKKTSSAFPKASCFSCHKEHGADDNVFTQFYPVLREARKISQLLDEPDPLTRFYWDRLGLFATRTPPECVSKRS